MPVPAPRIGFTITRDFGWTLACDSCSSVLAENISGEVILEDLDLAGSHDCRPQASDAEDMLLPAPRTPST